MSIFGYIDANDLLILSYYDRILCLGKNNHYIITGLRNTDCKNSQEVVKRLNRSVKLQAIQGQGLSQPDYFLVKLNRLDINILHLWGHGLDEHSNQIYSNGYPIFSKTSRSLSGGGVGILPYRASFPQTPPSYIWGFSQTGGGVADQLKYTHSTIFSGAMKSTLKLLIKSLKVTAGIGAVVASGGAGGDTIVGAISATIDSGMFAQQLLDVRTEVAKGNIYFKEIFEITFAGGPEDVHTQATNIIRKMVANGQIGQLDLMCPTLIDLLEGIGNIVGDWISTFIPDSGGLVGSVIESIISSAEKGSYNKLAMLFNKLPDFAQDLFKNPKKLNKFLKDILQFLEDILIKDQPTNAPPSTSSFLKTSVTMAIPGGQIMKASGFDKIIYTKIFDIIKLYYEPNIDKATQVVGIIMPLVFAILTINEFCLDHSLIDKLDKIKPRKIKRKKIKPSDQIIDNSVLPQNNLTLPQNTDVVSSVSPQPIISQQQPNREPVHDQTHYSLDSYINYLKSLFSGK